MTCNMRKAFIGGEIISADGDGILKKYEAMVTEEDKIIYVGDVDGVPEDAERIIIDGKTIVPGFTDSHLHASSMTELVFDVDILLGQPGTMLPRDEAIKAYREKLIEGFKGRTGENILYATGWDPGIFMGSEDGFPKASELDGIADDVPVIVNSYCHHYIWVNRKALEIAGITAEDEEPRNGKIWRDKDGNPEGVFQENTAISYLKRKIPESDYTVEQYKAGIKAFQDTFASPLGMTLVFDAYNSENGMKAYSELAESGELNIRVKTCFYADPAASAEQFDEMIAKKDAYHVSDLFNVDTVKFFMDGSGLSFFMNEPFEKEWLKMVGMPEDYRGYAQWEQDEINEIFTRLDKEGFQIHVHCMGDAAVKMTLDALEYAAERNGLGRRHTIAHVMNADESDLERFGKLQVVAAMQPMWAQYASLAETMSSKTLGMDRILDEYRIGKLIESGAVVSFGTDFPVTIPPSPILGMQTAVSRSVTTGQPDYEIFKERRLGPIDNQERDCITPAEALECCCYGGAYQCFLENVTGSLKPGMSADYVILNGSFTSCEDNEIESLTVAETYFKGKKVF